ncbi:MAG TPA: DUF1844 domain-containing protein [Thermoanaerobaculia bacterium]|nr:DUF1844 domain-containing protein [Thermoanaerobaculia bacterium]
MPKDKQPPKELKVFDKRIFTPDGEIREEFKQEIQPAAPQASAPAPAPEAASAPSPETPPQAPQRAAEPAPERPADRPVERPAERPAQPPRPERTEEERRRSVAERADSPGTPFVNFIEQLIVQAYMSLGMLRNPYQPQPKVDPPAARQMIDILQLLKEKTAGNLTLEEEDFLETHLGELKLAYVQRTKNIS